MLDWIVYFIAYFFAGFCLKLGDDLLDEMHRPSLAWYPLGASGVLFGLLMSNTEWDLVLLCSIVIGVLLSGKVNRKEFSIGFIAIAVMLLLLGIPPIMDFLGWLTILIMLFMASVFDEKGTEWTDIQANPFISRFFEYRFTLKITAILLVIPWIGLLPAAIGLLLFDIGYELAGFLIRRSASIDQ
ncbi:MAG: hypothetical protein ACFFED_01550 [Candidatus Thorarchaeota archaeon]